MTKVNVTAKSCCHFINVKCNHDKSECNSKINVNKLIHVFIYELRQKKINHCNTTINYVSFAVV